VSPDVHTKQVSDVQARKGPVDILLVGDSITQQCGGQGGAAFNAAWRKHFGQYKSVNIGVGGDKTQNVLWRLDHGGIAGLEPRRQELQDCPSLRRDRLDHHRKGPSMRLSIPALAALLRIPLSVLQAADFVVSPAGNDAHAGTKEKPFATFERAREAIREAKESWSTDGRFTVWLLGPGGP
jgi:hypothetical protein